MLIEASKPLIKQFNPVTVFICSDEISFIFDPNVEKLLFGGRTQKISSIFASKITLEFNQKIMQSLPVYEKLPNYKTIKETIEKGVCFDARVFNLPNQQEVLEYVLWRSSYDCVRNSKNLLAVCYYTQKELQGISTLYIPDKLLKEKNVDWNAYPNAFKYGTYIKKEKYMIEGFNPKENIKVETERTRFREISLLLDDSEKSREFLFSEFCDNRWF